MRVIFIDKSRIFAGAEYSLASLIEGLHKLSVDTLICADYPLSYHGKYINRGLNVIYRNKSLKWWMGSDYSLKSPRGTDMIKRIIFGFQLYNIIKKRKINICHINLLRNSDRIDILFARLAGCKVMGHVRALQSQASLQKPTLNSCNWLICTSDYVLSEIKELAGWNMARRIYNPIDVSSYSTQDLDIVTLKSKYGIESTKRVISSVAILDPRKGHDTAILALSEVLSTMRDVILLIAGGGPGDNDEEMRLKNLAESLNITNEIVFTGYIDSIKEIFAISDIILALSRDGEAFGRVPLEAAAAGKIVIATRLGATPEIVIDKTTGILVEADNHKEVSDKIVYLLQSKDIALKIAENAFRHVKDKFSVERHVASVMEVYGSL